jgi:hypothetical protein
MAWKITLPFPLPSALCSLLLFWGEFDSKTVDVFVDADLATETTVR